MTKGFVLQVRFMTLTGVYFRTVKTERFASDAEALDAVETYARESGYTKVKIVKSHEDDDELRFTATTPGGRAGRNIAFGTYLSAVGDE